MKWLMGNKKNKIDIVGNGRSKTYRAMDYDNQTCYYYCPGKKQLYISKTILVPQGNVKEEADRHQEACKKFAASHPYVTFHKVRVNDKLGKYSFSFTIPMSMATKNVMTELQNYTKGTLFV